ncbi:hypothetical protein THAOC_16200 [Thalassiosira oceanica]|uniref:Uncharacterized protein n=1 Tax=Thalassiosira oceanica TaxID=159749 RepID=K0SCT1_THAOC|nr:hypothetical protein THAOC_16200 [Thalassiosira oceanica]|eukprot:EJK63160.1 hypothetical protein THAOC_16200 [Thalassiosira oceanica]
MASSKACVSINVLRKTDNEGAIRAAIEFSDLLPPPGYSFDSTNENAEIAHLKRTLKRDFTLDEVYDTLCFFRDAEASAFKIAQKRDSVRNQKRLERTPGYHAMAAQMMANGIAGPTYFGSGMRTYDQVQSDKSDECALDWDQVTRAGGTKQQSRMTSDYLSLPSKGGLRSLCWVVGSSLPMGRHSNEWVLFASMSPIHIKAALQHSAIFGGLGVGGKRWLASQTPTNTLCLPDGILL